MDPGDTPGYRIHRALSNLTRIDIEQLESAVRERESPWMNFYLNFRNGLTEIGVSQSHSTNSTN